MPLGNSGSKDSRTGGFGGSIPNKGKGSKSKNAVKWLKVLYWCLVISGIWFAFLNVAPYAKAVGMLSSKNVNSAFITFVGFIPIIGRLLLALGTGVQWLLGLALWGVIQIIEVLPVILYNHQDFLSTMIKNADSHSKHSIKEDDDPALKMLKKTYNALPVSIVSNLETLKLITYTVDFCICTTVYAPVRSGKLSDFLWVLGTGQWNKLQWDNLLLAFITLFAIEVIVQLILWVGKLAYQIKQSSSQY
jgi:hypothetical protein